MSKGLLIHGLKQDHPECQKWGKILSASLQSGDYVQFAHDLHRCPVDAQYAAKQICDVPNELDVERVMRRYYNFVGSLRKLIGKPVELPSTTVEPPIEFNW